MSVHRGLFLGCLRLCSIRDKCIKAMKAKQGSSLLPTDIPLPMPQSRAPLTVFTASQTGTKPRQNLDSLSQATFVAVPTDLDDFQLLLGSQTRADRLANTGAYTDKTGGKRVHWLALCRDWTLVPGRGQLKQPLKPCKDCQPVPRSPLYFLMHLLQASI